MQPQFRLYGDTIRQNTVCVQSKKEGTMRTQSIITLVTVIGFASILGACNVTTQTTSGKDWLAAYPKAGQAQATGGDIDAQVRAAANVEPTLRFPARIGIARLGPSGLGPIPAEEAAHWTDAAEHLGPGFGTFVPISPMIAAMVEPSFADAATRPSFARQTIDTIRLAAAREHVDAVLVYEVDGTANARDTKLSLADWTLIGAFVLPTQNVKVAGVAQAMLIDVRNGYPYGTVQSTVDDDGLTTRIDWSGKGKALEDKVKASAVLKLTGEAETMLRKLKPELAALDSKR